MRTLTIRIPDDIQAELKMVSKAEHVPLSDLVRDSLRTYLAVRRFRKLRKRILPLAETQGILTDEDVFKLR